MDDKIFLTWNDFENDVIALSEKIKIYGAYNKIVAISRGGLIPAGCLSYLLDIRHTKSINISSYFGEKQVRIKAIDEVSEIGIVNEETLIVDDLVDSGQTFLTLKNYFPQATYVSVYAKSRGLGVADVFAKELPDKWVVFPWDVL